MSEDKEEETKTVIVMAFDGTDEKYQKWWLRFKAHYKLAVFNKAIRTAPKVGLLSNQVEAPALTRSKPEKMKKKETAMNNKDMTIFTL